MYSCYKIRVSLTLFCYRHSGLCQPLDFSGNRVRRSQPESASDTSFPPTSSTKAFVHLSALTALALSADGGDKTYFSQERSKTSLLPYPPTMTIHTIAHPLQEFALRPALTWEPIPAVLPYNS